MKQGICLLLTVGESPSCPVTGWQAFSLELPEMCFDVLFCGIQLPSLLAGPCYWSRSHGLYGPLPAAALSFCSFPFLVVLES